VLKDIPVHSSFHAASFIFLHVQQLSVFLVFVREFGSRVREINFLDMFVTFLIHIFNPFEFSVLEEYPSIQTVKCSTDTVEHYAIRLSLSQNCILGTQQYHVTSSRVFSRDSALASTRVARLDKNETNMAVHEVDRRSSCHSSLIRLLLFCSDLLDYRVNCRPL